MNARKCSEVTFLIILFFLLFYKYYFKKSPVKINRGLSIVLRKFTVYQKIKALNDKIR